MDLSDTVSQSSGLAPVQPAVPQGLVPVWAVGNTSMVVPANAFWMISPPPAAAAVAAPVGTSSNQQAQIWALAPSVTPVFNVAAAARPLSSLVAATSVPQVWPVAAASNSAVSTSTAVGAKVSKKSSMAPSVSSSSGTASASASGKAQMLRDFSLEICDKQELQFMGTTHHA